MELTIKGNPDGSVTITGPIDNKSVCYALLELARDAIKDHTDALAKSPIVRAPELPGGPRRHN